MATDYYCKEYQSTINGLTFKASDNPNLPPMYAHFQRNGNGDSDKVKVYSTEAGITKYRVFTGLQSATLTTGQHIQEYENPYVSPIIRIGDNFKSGVRMFVEGGYFDFVKCRSTRPKNSIIF